MDIKQLEQPKSLPTKGKPKRSSKRDLIALEHQQNESNKKAKQTWVAKQPIFVHNPNLDENRGFRSLAVALLGDEKRYIDIKVRMREFFINNRGKTIY
ncbi:hypothetical protein BDB00DRAFT_877135 [Zychaea mexicana]|uniref:uncharacterized protein n=1 Tax=Zychaea mexicana TaxID=64656 RepID=UPI0022FE86C5|nr:uncharacterized protein BDB00DRAFT_877135 [Zychaea mexicana]KAI9488777.1 hypothetical protein BDB00DRAFT_877135 [Zychaea mexicana]